MHFYTHPKTLRDALKAFAGVFMGQGLQFKNASVHGDLVTKKWQVHKFGGTSVLDAERYRNVSEIVTGLSFPGAKAIVVSAMKGVTDDLIEIEQMTKTPGSEWNSRLKKIQDRHHREIVNLIQSPASLLARVDADFKNLQELLLTRTSTANRQELVSGMGEVWSAQILDSYFQQQGKISRWLDARKILVIDSTANRVNVDWESSLHNLRQWQTQNPQDLIVITGFIAGTKDGTATTLGRNGSDFSASIFAALLDRLSGCEEISIWTDVDGVFSADPRQVPEAVILQEMSYHEVSELAYFGAKVVHPATMLPAITRGIPVRIRNSLNSAHPGTKIHKEALSKNTVKGFSTIDKMALINIEGTGMVGIPGVAQRVFASLHQALVNVVLISQASSEQSICLAVSEDQCKIARDAIHQTFAGEIQMGLIDTIQVTKGISILAAVGDNMARSPGVAGRFFTALGRSGVNVRAIAQGSSERNISAVIDSVDALRALRTVHSSFVLPHQTFSVGLIGTGLIGGTFLRQIDEQLTELKKNRKLDVQIRAIANSKQMLLSEKQISLKEWREQFAKQAVPLNLRAFAQHVRPSHIPHAVIIDATASSTLTENYCNWLKHGLHIISPNKKANAGSISEYLQIREAAKDSHRHFLYSTNVGAGLPILQTLRDLCATGDQLFAIEGILSGTLSYIFNSFDERKNFSQVVQEAKQLGYTEPDPREDLSGQDVVRKLVILAREAGTHIEIKDVTVESLIPQNLQAVSKEEFMSRLSELDQPLLQKFKEAKSQNQVLRFVGTMDQAGKVSVGLKALPASHAFAHTTGTDNIVLFKTKRYFHQPLVVQGPGAGPEVTAAGVFADLLRLSQYLGAPP